MLFYSTFISMHACCLLDIPFCCCFISGSMNEDELGEQSTSAGSGYQLAFSWQNTVNTLFGNSSHKSINSDPSSVELYIKTTELFAGLGLPQSATD